MRTGSVNYVAFGLVAMLGVVLAGCESKATELERFADQVLSKVIEPAVDKAIEETSTRTATLQGGAQVIEPGYAVVMDGFFGTGVHAVLTVRAVGVSGQLVGHVQADAGQEGAVPPPVERSVAASATEQ